MGDLEIITICAGYVNSKDEIMKCNKIRVNGNWETLNVIRNKYSNLYRKYIMAVNCEENFRLSHACCPDCHKKYNEELDKEFLKSNGLADMTEKNVWPLEIPRELFG